MSAFGSEQYEKNEIADSIQRYIELNPNMSHRDIVINIMEAVTYAMLSLPTENGGNHELNE